MNAAAARLVCRENHCFKLRGWCPRVLVFTTTYWTASRVAKIIV
jgi:hypothetical protein